MVGRPSPRASANFRPSANGKPRDTKTARLGRFPKGHAHPQGTVNTRYTKAHKISRINVELEHAERMLPDQKPRRYTITEATVDVAPTSAPNGKTLSLSLIFMPTAPAVAWKKLPCGSASMIVPPA